MVRLQIWVIGRDIPGIPGMVDLKIDLDVTIGKVIAEIVEMKQLPRDRGTWVLIHGNSPCSDEEVLRDVLQRLSLDPRGVVAGWVLFYRHPDAVLGVTAPKLEADFKIDLSKLDRVRGPSVVITSEESGEYESTKMVPLDSFPPASRSRLGWAEPASAMPTSTTPAPRVSRRATVRYYSRMNPDRLVPLLVILSAEQIEKIVQEAVEQAEGTPFQVEKGSTIEIEPILPGCDVYPPKETISVSNAPVTANFWMMPRVLGTVAGARVVLRQNGRVLSEVSLDMYVSRQTVAKLVGMLSLVAPFGTMLLEAANLDFKSQQEQGFAFYRQAMAWVVESVRPEFLGLGLLGLAVMCYFWTRPKKRDQFWDVTAKPVTSSRE